MGVPAALLGIQRSIDVFVYVGIIMLFYILFVFYGKLEEQREKITRLTRILAIQGREIDLILDKQPKKAAKKKPAKKKKSTKRRK
jgi:hypothetical protein